ncbi:hypothetical protein EYC59_02125 [Candidatus Saccharibacteria bacterium]|nr:MAG: hypothetical protein EYC59_02125 [Candidatus Saccharibacteria bacterium]
MSDRITKFLKRLSNKEYDRIVPVIERIMAGELQGLDVKALVGRKHMFRVRFGRIRIIFMNDGSSTTVTAITNRDDKTYKIL